LGVAPDVNPASITVLYATSQESDLDPSDCVNRLDTSQLLPRLQSAYRSKHSTETALVKVLSDILLAIDTGDLAALVLLDLFAAFDTIDHAILLRRLETFGLGGTALHWFESYLVGRRQHVLTAATFSHRPSSSAVYHRALFLAPSSFSYTSPICSC